jgi:dUTP pyrophosphatase
MIEVKVVNKSLNNLPKYETPNSAGMDLKANLTNLDTKYFHFADFDEERDTLIIFSGGRALIPTGLYTEIPKGYEAQIRPRSGLALKYAITVLNTPGTIDSDYRNEWGIIIINLGDDPFEIKTGDRIGQVVFNKVEEVVWDQVENLEDLNKTNRFGGFGHTGK